MGPAAVHVKSRAAADVLLATIHMCCLASKTEKDFIQVLLAFSHGRHVPPAE